MSASGVQRGRGFGVVAGVSLACVVAIALAGGLLTGAARADQALPVCGSLFAPGFSATPNPALVGQAVAFDGSCSKVPCPAFGSFSNCVPNSYSWQLGDGASASTATASHAYGAAGTYNVTLTVTDYDGASYSVSHQVTVAAVP